MNDERIERDPGEGGRHENDVDRPPEWLETMRRLYHEPPEAPREEMWAVIRAGLKRGASETARVAPLHASRRRTSPPWRVPVAWSAVAAAGLAVGIGIGRWSAVQTGSAPTTVQAPLAAASSVEAAPSSGLEQAAIRHLGRTESLLVTVRTDARAGALDASVRPWARSLLAETRLLMDARGGEGDEVHRLLADLELVLMEIVGATEGAADPERRRTELDLTVRSLEASDVLSRIRSALPVSMSGA